MRRFARAELYAIAALVFGALVAAWRGLAWVVRKWCGE